MPLPLFKTAEKTSKPAIAKPNNQIRNTIAIAAGKGGVGKSTITVNLAFALTHLGFSVGIVDADLYGPSLRKMLPESEYPKQENNLIYPAVSNGIKTISMAYFRPDRLPTALRAPQANAIIHQFLTSVVWNELDFLLFDFPPGTGDIQITLCQRAHIDAAVAITTPQEVALLDVRKAIALFQQLHIPVVGVIENMSYFRPTSSMDTFYPFGQGGGAKLASEFGLPLLAEIPIDAEVSKRADLGLSLFSSDDSNLPTPSNPFLVAARQLIVHINALKQHKNGLDNFEIIWKDMPLDEQKTSCYYRN